MTTIKISRQRNTVNIRRVNRTFKIQHTGRRGAQGPTGPQGERGSPGEVGELALAAITADYTTSDIDDIIEANTSSGQVTVTLHSAVTARQKRYSISRSGAGLNNLVIAPISGQTINGESSITLWQPYTSVDLTPDGSNWRLI